MSQGPQGDPENEQVFGDGSAIKALEGPLPNGTGPRISDAGIASTTTPRRRPGRPPRRPEAMLYGLGSPPAPRIIPLPAHNPRERLNLPKPSYRKIATFAAYEDDEGVQVNYVDRSMANAGFQESEMYLRSDRKFIRLEEEAPPEDSGASLVLESEKAEVPSMNTSLVTRVEYDMDEQDGQWLEAQNLTRKNEQVEAIKPGIFEITMTQIEKEWHALEKSGSNFQCCSRRYICHILMAILRRDSEAQSETTANSQTPLQFCRCCQRRTHGGRRGTRQQVRRL